jgi:hypothetical protein
MAPTPSAPVSSATSDSLYDLDLPVVREGEEPLPLEEPSYELMRAHARWLLRSQPPHSPAAQPNPEPFVLD